MKLQVDSPAAYLGDEVIDVSHPSIRHFAARLRAEYPDELSFAQAAFQYARHSWDAQDPRVTLSASRTFREGIGLCFAKTHRLAGLLRAEGIPTGLCLQRLTDDGSSYVLHGLVAVYLQGRWHRQDPRGNKLGVNAQFSLTTERLAWPVRAEMGESDLTQLLVNPHPDVVRALRGATDVLALCREGLPSHL